MKRFRTTCGAGTALLFAAGCAVGPHYAPPKTALAPEFSEIPKGPTPMAASRMMPGVESVARWWLVFGDPRLNSLIERAVEGNLDLQQAISRVRQARAQRAALAAGLWPEVDASAGYNRGHGSKNIVIPFGGGGSSAAPPSAASRAPVKALTSETDDSPAGNPGGGVAAASGGAPLSPFGQGGLPGATTNVYQVGFDSTWEIDLFGGTRRTVEAADAGVDAAGEAGRAVLVSLVAEVAETYVELRTNQQRLRIARDHLAAQREALGVAEAKFKTGFATELDVAQQRAQAASTAAVIPALEAAERESFHALAFMIDVPPNALADELAPSGALLPLPAEVPVGVPSDLLQRRPDIRRAERELAQATAQVGAATAELFPKFSLTGAVGFDSSDVKHLGDWESHYYSIAPGIHWPILDWGRIRAGVRLETERQQEAFLGYQKAVAQALKEVEDALVRYENEQIRRASLGEAADASRRARALAQQRYVHGVADVLTTIETQRTLLQAEDELAQSDGALRRDLIALYKALGGGWE